VDTVHECDRQTDGRTDRLTGRWTDRITITKTVQRRASHGKKLPKSEYRKAVKSKMAFKMAASRPIVDEPIFLSD